MAGLVDGLVVGLAGSFAGGLARFAGRDLGTRLQLLDALHRGWRHPWKRFKDS
jgi:hypothetical protein